MEQRWHYTCNISVSTRWIPAFSVLISICRPSLLKLTPYLLFSQATFKCNLNGPISFFLAFRRSAYKHWRLFHLPVVLFTSSSSINSPSGGCWPWEHRGSNWRSLSSVVALHFGTAKVSQMATSVKHTRVLWLLCNLELFKSLSTYVFLNIVLSMLSLEKPLPIHIFLNFDTAVVSFVNANGSQLLHGNIISSTAFPQSTCLFFFLLSFIHLNFLLFSLLLPSSLCISWIFDPSVSQFISILLELANWSTARPDMDVPAQVTVG